MPEKPDERPAGASKPQAKITPAAKRALAEAEQRRKARAQTGPASGEEAGGRGGLDPARYGDWEKDGLASDF